MKLTCIVILASVTVCNLTVCGGQAAPEDETRDRKTIDDIILQRAESLLLRSILKKIEDNDGSNEGLSSQPEWLEKRQHPGKRYYSQDLEKRQHPGRRAEEEEDDQDSEFQQDVQKRQHPGKREEDELMDSFVELEKRQHPGKRGGGSLLLDELASENPPALLFSELSKRQHPGKRDEDWEDQQQALEKRQHPGKRGSDNAIISGVVPDDLGTNSPCKVLDPAKCGQANLLMHLLQHLSESRAEEKRQHPGKRSAPEEDLVEPE